MPTPQTWQERFDERFQPTLLDEMEVVWMKLKHNAASCEDIKSFIAEELEKADQLGYLRGLKFANDTLEAAEESLMKKE